MSIRCIFAFLHFYSIHEGAVNLHVQKSTILYMQLACYLYIYIYNKKTFLHKKVHAHSTRIYNLSDMTLKRHNSKQFNTDAVHSGKSSVLIHKCLVF